jgi:hypothetical protein
MKDAGPGVVAPVWRLRVWQSDLETVDNDRNGAGAFTRFL